MDYKIERLLSIVGSAIDEKTTFYENDLQNIYDVLVEYKTVLAFLRIINSMPTNTDIKDKYLAEINHITGIDPFLLEC